MYGLLLLVTVIISCIMLAPGVQDLLTKVPFCEESPTLISRLLEGKNFSLFYFNYISLLFSRESDSRDSVR